MAVITPDTFDPLKRFVSVRLQQGVPLVDADWNEGQDAQRFTSRSYRRWYVGDGVPYGSDAFRIQALAAPAANDFLIGRGVAAAPGGTPPLTIGLHHTGRCLVDGLEAIIDGDVAFRAQELHVANLGAAAAAIRLNTKTIPELPVLNGTLLIYLDVWERLARPDEFPALVFVDIGTESCARIRREWVVRARAAATVPQAGDPDFEAGHGYFQLAMLTRVAADPIIFPSQITDRREQRLLTPPATLIEDMLGLAPDSYRRGEGRPAIPLRAAVNALLRGQLPASVDQAIAPDPANDLATRAFARVNDTTVMLWESNRVAAIPQIFAASWAIGDPASAGTNPPIQVTSGAVAANLPSLTLLPTSPAPALFMTYQRNNNIFFRRAAGVAGLPAAAETPVAQQVDPEAHSVAVRAGQIVTVFWIVNGAGVNDFIRYRRRQYNAAWDEGTATWLDTETTNLSTLQVALPSTTPGVFHATADAAGRVWVAFEAVAASAIGVARLTPASGAIETWTNTTLASPGVSADTQPFVLIDGAQHVQLFWRADAGIFMATCDVVANTWSAATAVPIAGAGPAGSNSRPVAVREDDGGIWLLWSHLDNGQTNIWAARRDPLTGGWGLARQITASAGNNDFAYATIESGAITLFFRSNRSGDFNLFTKQIVTTI
ncbi:hypothetical protein [Sphingomonas sp. ERG5]|uniref:hypothetical protein n=1 Tax=Sphingomonas sp. ERG5 TaxID=1381597 RepID=UPI00054B9385|nr:hypothetical protein [Sphingomonas sp. ERG5]